MSKGKSLTTSEFIDRAKHIHHEDKYLYDKTKYINAETKVEITCKRHDSFWITPLNHLYNKQGCKKCYNENRTKSLETFIAESNKIHNNVYDYSCVRYITTKIKVEIICPAHGSFWQKPVEHISGKGCIECGIKKNAKIRSFSTEEFKLRANSIHIYLYAYECVKYTNNHTKVEIICPSHGNFWQTPHSHLAGNGCPKCTSIISKPETEWLDSFNNPNICRQQCLRINGRLFKVDGFDHETNTIYEFLGDYWHGNPKRFKSADLNKHVQKTFGTLWNESMQKISFLQENGYIINYIWESEFKKLNGRS